MFSMFDPNTSPAESAGEFIRTAVMLVTSSGREVPPPISSAPTHNLPHPVLIAMIFPDIASPIPATTTKAADTKNKIMAICNSKDVVLFLYRVHFNCGKYSKSFSVDSITILIVSI